MKIMMTYFVGIALFLILIKWVVYARKELTIHLLRWPFIMETMTLKCGKIEMEFKIFSKILIFGYS
jgi:hypothetical protein